MRAQLYTAPTIEPITMSELRDHLRLDSDTLAGSPVTYTSIAAGGHGVHELMTLDVAPGGAGWAAGDTITGQTSAKTCVVVQVLTSTTYYVRSRSGTYTLGEVLSNGTVTADQGAAYPTFAGGYYLIGTSVDVSGKSAIVSLDADTVPVGGTVDAKIQDSSDGTTWTDFTGGAFTQVTSLNDNAVQEKSYTGAKKYIRVAAYVAAASALGADCEFSASVVLDEDLYDLIVDGRTYVEAVTRRALLTQTWDYYLHEWPDGNCITLPFGNLQSVSSVSWKDSDGTETTLTVTTDYLAETNGNQCGRVVLPFSVSWPSGELYPVNPIKVRFVCGWLSAAAVPRNIKRAVKLAAEDAYYHGDRSEILRPAIDSLLSSYRLWEEF
jgi:uncharacterized phiE125 gp8 family phage protein